MEKNEILKQERERIAEIEVLCREYGLEDRLADYIKQGTDILEVRKAALNVMGERLRETNELGHRGPYPYESEFRSPATIIRDESDKRIAATVDGQVLKSGLPLENPAPGANEYRASTPADLAEECLTIAGVRTRGWSKDRIIREALSSRAAYTGDFPSILANVQNKILRTAYQLTPSTFELWTNITDGVDFKEMSRVQLSEAGDLDEIPEHGEYRYGSFGESKEVFQISTFGKLFAITRQALVNDDQMAFARVPQQHAGAAKRLVNYSVYAVLMANAVMSDGYALFSTQHSNFVANGSGAAPDETTLSAGRVAMRTQEGLNGAILNIAPEFLIVPAALETTADKLLNSTGDLTDSKNAGVINPFYKKLTPVVESCLDGNDPAAWFLAGNPKACDTIEVCFLGGMREPFLETKQGWSVDGVEYKVRIEFGVKAIDWRALYMNDGN